MKVFDGSSREVKRIWRLATVIVEPVKSVLKYFTGMSLYRIVVPVQLKEHESGPLHMNVYDPRSFSLYSSSSEKGLYLSVYLSILRSDWLSYY